MIGRFIDKILDLRIFRSFKVRTTPRWIILLLDMAIVLACYACTVLADSYSQFHPTDSMRVISVGALVLLVYFVITFCSFLHFQELYLCYSSLGHRGLVPHLHGCCRFDPVVSNNQHIVAGHHAHRTHEVLEYLDYRCLVILDDDD